MGKNTPDRQEFIISNLRIEEELGDIAYFPQENAFKIKKGTAIRLVMRPKP